MALRFCRLEIDFSHPRGDNFAGIVQSRTKLRKLPGLPISNPRSLPFWRRPNRRRKGKERHLTPVFIRRKNEWVGMIVQTVVHITFHGNLRNDFYITWMSFRYLSQHFVRWLQNQISWQIKLNSRLTDNKNGKSWLKTEDGWNSAHSRR